MFGIDRSKYRGNIKGLIFFLSYRIANWCVRSKFRKIFFFPIWILYRLTFNWILGIDISEATAIGKNLMIWHGIGLIVHPMAVIGDNVTLRHNTTIGTAHPSGKCPIIGDNVDIGTGCIILGDITIGENAVIGAGSVITKSVPPKAIVVGNPARIIRFIE